MFCASGVVVLCIRGRCFMHKGYGFCASGGVLLSMVGVLSIRGRSFVHQG